MNEQIIGFGVILPPPSGGRESRSRAATPGVAAGGVPLADAHHRLSGGVLASRMPPHKARGDWAGARKSVMAAIRLEPASLRHGSVLRLLARLTSPGPAPRRGSGSAREEGTVVRQAS
jgi:hypothetical protein